MNQRIERLEREIAQAEREIAELKGRLKGLREDRDKLVDAEIVKRVRAASRKGADIEELLAIIEGSAWLPHWSIGSPPETPENPRK